MAKSEGYVTKRATFAEKRYVPMIVHRRINEARAAGRGGKYAEAVCGDINVVRLMWQAEFQRQAARARVP